MGQSMETGYNPCLEWEHRVVRISQEVEVVHTWSLDSSLRSVEASCPLTADNRFQVLTASAEPRHL